MLSFAGGDRHPHPEAEGEPNAEADHRRLDPGPAEVVARVQVSHQASPSTNLGTVSQSTTSKP